VKIKLVLANPQTAKLGMVFEQVEEAKTIFNIKNYSLSQTTLEQIFIEFARIPDWRQPPAQSQLMAAQQPGAQVVNPGPGYQDATGTQPKKEGEQPHHTSSAQVSPFPTQPESDQQEKTVRVASV